MISGAAGHDHNFINIADVFICHAQFLNDNFTFPDTGADGVTDCLWLLIDFFQEEVFIASLFSGIDIPVDAGAFFFKRFLVHVVKFNSVTAENGNFFVLHIKNFPCILKNGRDIGGDEITAFAVADNQRTVFPGREDLARIVVEEDAEGIGTLHLLHNPGERLKRVMAALVIIIQQVSQYLGIGF